jgi:outer membrane receptor protein involved in Fe transport
LRTNLAGRTNFVAGINYQSSQSQSLVSRLSNEYDFVNQVGGLTELGLFLRDPSPAFQFFSYPATIVQEAATEFDSLSAFGEIYADLSDRVKLTIGLRYNRDEKKIADRTVNFAEAVDLNAPSIADGALGPGPVWVRRLALEDPTFLDTLRAFYGVPEDTDPLSALLQVPFVPQINEQRLISGTPTKQTWDAWTGRAVLSWQAKEDLLVYGSFARGYKPGGFNPGTTFFGEPPVPGVDATVTYDREDVNSFEIGLKGKFWNGSLGMNIAGFFNDYDQLQLANNAQRLSPGAINDNVDAEMYGAEVELRWRPLAVPRAEFELGYAWLNATLKKGPPRLDQLDPTGGNHEYVALGVPYRLPYVARTEEVLPLVDLAIATGYANGPDEAPAGQYPNGIPATFSPEFLEFFGVETLPWMLVDVSGNRIPEAPEHTLHLAATYTWDLGAGALTVRWDYYWRDDSFMTVFNRPSHRIRSWDQHNATLVFESSSGRWSARAWIKNIANDTHITGGLRTAFTDAFAVTDPRAFGGSFRYNFGAL